jgi:hypothetical protein
MSNKQSDGAETDFGALALPRRNVLVGGTALAAASALGAGVPLQVAQAQQLAAPPIAPSPSWMRALPPGPDVRVKITEEYARHVARDAYFWAWPLVNMYNRRLAFSRMKEHRYLGPLLEAPLNRLTMLRDYIDPEERNTASPNETKYFYQDLDASGGRLNSANRYTVTFAKDATPPVNGFWSLSIYNEHHLFVANPINRFSVGTKNKDLRLAADGSPTIYVQSNAPTDPAQRANWLPAPKGDFSLFMRAYWPKPAALDGSWTPPAVQRT